MCVYDLRAACVHKGMMQNQAWRLRETPILGLYERAIRCWNFSVCKAAFSFSWPACLHLGTLRKDMIMSIQIQKIWACASISTWGFIEKPVLSITSSGEIGFWEHDIEASKIQGRARGRKGERNTYHINPYHHITMEFGGYLLNVAKTPQGVLSYQKATGIFNNPHMDKRLTFSQYFLITSLCDYASSKALCHEKAESCEHCDLGYGFPLFPSSLETGWTHIIWWLDDLFLGKT